MIREKVHYLLISTKNCSYELFQNLNLKDRIVEVSERVLLLMFVVHKSDQNEICNGKVKCRAFSKKNIFKKL